MKFDKNLLLKRLIHNRYFYFEENFNSTGYEHLLVSKKGTCYYFSDSDTLQKIKVREIK